ncbi:MAG TPA: NAD-dependent dihydropyrimidine dehydrogenase subunit PreA [Chthoniobacterales bacterium]|nr:NAD-dependent dihydropyrimidine dehydrogenase subunit PreA [Chthoniobacterales bacterium]
MATLATTVDGLKLPNPFVIGSGPPGTNLNVITRAFREGWGAVIAKTISLDSSKVVNVTPRYAKLMGADGKDVVGWENIELISDRKFEIWMDEFKKCKDEFPDGVLIASIMEEYNKDAWAEIVERCQDAGADSFELNFSCPHGLPERKMGAAMGENPEIVEEVVGWVMKSAKKPVWAKMTPNVTRITDPSRAAFRGGCEGVSAINTIRSVMSVNLETLRPEPSVEGYTTPGGYSCKAVRPIALRMIMEIATMIRREFPGKSLSAIGGIETGDDAAQFILLGGDTAQVCTGVMKHGYGMVKKMCEELLAFMEKHKFETLADFKGKSLDYFTTHAELVRMQKERKEKDKAAADAAAAAKKIVRADDQWSGDDFVKQSDALARG